MAPRLLLHIGTEKTGTTAWQAWLAHQREALDQRGFAVPTSLGPTNHRKLPTSCFDLDRVDDMVIRSGLAPTTAADRQRTYRAWQQAFATEVQQRPHHTWLVSSEHCSSRLTRPVELARLQLCLKELFAETIVLLVSGIPRRPLSRPEHPGAQRGYPLEELPPPDHPFWLIAVTTGPRCSVGSTCSLSCSCTFINGMSCSCSARLRGCRLAGGSGSPAAAQFLTPHRAIAAIARLNRELPVYRGASLVPSGSSASPRSCRPMPARPASCPVRSNASSSRPFRRLEHLDSAPVFPSAPARSAEFGGAGEVHHPEAVAGLPCGSTMAQPSTMRWR